MQTIVKFFISLLFALVIGILPAPVPSAFAATTTDSVQPVPNNTAVERCGMVLPQAAVRDSIAEADC